MRFKFAVLRGFVCAPFSRLRRLFWVEGEKPAVNKMNRIPVITPGEKGPASGGDFISNFNRTSRRGGIQIHGEKCGRLRILGAGQSSSIQLTYSLNGSTEFAIDLAREKRDELNVAGDGKPDTSWLEKQAVQ